MANQVLFYCPCTSQLSVSRPPSVESALAYFRHHPLSSLLFCEECDAIRCDSCVSCEVACYYCPNCLFEVPSASVRGEKNRCARNCFQCPQCSHTLSVVASDPAIHLPPASTAASVGEPPFYLSCNFCHWDSKEIGMFYEKATGLAMQVQKQEDAAPDVAEFSRLRAHFEPYLRRGQSIASSSASVLSTSSTKYAGTASASASLLKDPSGLIGSRYGSLLGLPSRAKQVATSQQGVRDYCEPYTSLYPCRTIVGDQQQHPDKGKPPSERQQVDRDEEMVNKMRYMTDIEQFSSLERRWTISYKQPLLTEELRPLRTHLQTKLSKRCPVCKHILIKPEQKSTSTRYKIKLVAANYIPGIEIHKRPPATMGSRLSAIGTAATTSAQSRKSGSRLTVRGLTATRQDGKTEDEVLRPGRTYSYELTFTNPLYEPIQVRLAVARPDPPVFVPPMVEGQGVERAVDDAAVDPPAPPPFAVNLPSPTFPISAFAEQWEYEDEETFDMNDDQDDLSTSKPGAFMGKGARGSSAGILEKRMNRITVLMEVAVGRHTLGPLRANMLVTYAYQSDESDRPPSPAKSPVKGGPALKNKEEAKTFSFWAMLYLGTVVPRKAVAAVE